MTTAASASNPFPGGHPRRKQILGVLCLSLLMVVIDNTILNTALPTIARTLHASASQLQWIVDGYTLAFAALLVTAGSLGDRFGRRGALIGGLTVFAAGSICAGLSDSSTTLIASRVFMALGGAFVMPATLSIINTVFPSEERAGAIGAWSAMSGVGIVLGPTLGGLLLTHFSWASVFWVNVPLAIVAAVLATLVVPTVPGVREEGSGIDLPGAVMSAGAMTTILYAVIEAPDYGWTSLQTLGMAGLGVALGAAFIAWELRAKHPMFDVKIFKNRAFSAASAAITVNFFALFGGLFALTQFMQMVQGRSTLFAGLGAMPFAVSVLILAPLSSTLVKRFGARRLIPVGLTLLASGLLVASTISVDSHYIHLGISVFLMGAGMGLTVSPASSSIMASLPREQAGAGSAVNDTVQELGGALGVAVIGSLVTASYASSIDSSGLPAAITQPARGSLQAAQVVASQAGDLAGKVLSTSHVAYTSAMDHGFVAAAGVALFGAACAAIFLPSRAATATATAGDEFAVARDVEQRPMVVVS